MKTLALRFIADESGLTNCEYGLRAALVASIAIMLVQIGSSELSGAINRAAGRVSHWSHPLTSH